MELDQSRNEAKSHLGDYELTRSEAIQEAVKIICNPVVSAEKPELESVKTVELYCGDRATKFVVWGIRDGESGESKGKNLGLQTIRRTKARGWETDPEKSITIEDDGIDILRKFLNELPQLPIDGEYLLLDAANPISQFLDALSGHSLEAGDFSKILRLLVDSGNITKLVALPSESLQLGKAVAAALNYAEMSQTLDEFERLVEHGCDKCVACKSGKVCLEGTFQSFLKANPWIFGSQYSKVTPKKITYDGDELDYLARRTADDYEEIVEIKRPIKDLFRDRGQKGLAENKPVVDAVNQVDNYIAGIEADRYKYDSEERGYLKVEKIRAKIIIGRDSADPAKQRALRRLNARYNRIEVITYDQLIATARQMLSWLETEIHDTSAKEPDAPVWAQTVDDIPF